MLNIDLSKANNNDKSFGLLPKGTYECTVDNAKIDTTANKHDYISLVFKVRDDLDKALPETNGKHHGRLIFGNSWFDNKENKWRDVDLANMASAAGYTQDQVNKFADLEEFVKSFIGKDISVYVFISKDDDGNERNSTTPKCWVPTKFPRKKPVDPFAGNDGTVEINDSDIPF